MLSRADILSSLITFLISVKSDQDKIDFIRSIKSAITKKDLTRGNMGPYCKTPEFLQLATQLLALTADFDKYKMINILLSSGADINYCPVEGSLPLCAAVGINDPAMINFLLINSANVNQPLKCGTRSTGFTPLHCAAISGSLEAAICLLDNGANQNVPLYNLENNDPYGIFNSTPLHFACITGFDSIVELLISRKANVNATNLEGLTPLHDAAAAGYASIVEKLLNAGANPEIKDLHGHSVISAAIRRCAEALGCEHNPLNQSDYVAVITHLLKRGIQASEEDISLALEYKQNDVYALLSRNKNQLTYSGSPTMFPFEPKPVSVNASQSASQNLGY